MPIRSSSDVLEHVYFQQCVLHLGAEPSPVCEDAAVQLNLVPAFGSTPAKPLIANPHEDSF